MTLASKCFFNLGLFLSQELAYDYGIKTQLAEDLYPYYDRGTPDEEEDKYHYTGERRIDYDFGDDNE